MEYLRQHNTQKSIKAILARMDEDTRKLAELHSIGILERNTDRSRGELMDIIKHMQEARDILAHLQGRALQEPKETTVLIGLSPATSAMLTGMKR